MSPARHRCWHYFTCRCCLNTYQCGGFKDEPKYCTACIDLPNVEKELKHIRAKAEKDLNKGGLNGKKYEIR
jgi:hypothetical protein